MRLDVFLKLSRLIPSRTLAKEFAKMGLVSVNDVVAKSSRDLYLGDELEIRRLDRVLKIRVLKVPHTKQVSKRDASGLYAVLSEEILNTDPLFD